MSQLVGETASNSTIKFGNLAVPICTALGPKLAEDNETQATSCGVSPRAYSAACVSLYEMQKASGEDAIASKVGAIPS